MKHIAAKLETPWRLLGFCFMQTWVFLIALSPAALTENPLFLEGSFAAGLMLSGCLLVSTVLLVAIGSFRDIFRSSRALVFSSAIASVGSTLMLTAGGNAAAAAVGIVLADFGSAYLSLRWGKHWADLDTERMAVHLSLSTLASCLIYTAVCSIPASIAFAPTAALPLLSGAILLLSKDEPRRKIPEPEASVTPSLWKAAVMLAAVPVAYSLVRSFFSKGNLAIFGTQGSLTMLSFFSCALLILAIVLRASKRRSMVLLYRAVVAMMSAGFVAILALPEGFEWVALGAIMLSYSIFDELVWLMRPQLTVDVAGVRLNVFGWGRVVFRSFAFAGVALGGWLLRQEWLTDSAALIACMLMIALVVLFFMNTLTADDFFRFINPIRVEDGADTAPSSESSLDESCALIAGECGLSRREAEVLQYLARGRSLSVIESQLCISNSTARTHTRNIYRKLDVHSKQELIDMVERAQEG